MNSELLIDNQHMFSTTPGKIINFRECSTPTYQCKWLFIKLFKTSRKYKNSQPCQCRFHEKTNVKSLTLKEKSIHCQLIRRAYFKSDYIELSKRIKLNAEIAYLAKGARSI